MIIFFRVLFFGLFLASVIALVNPRWYFKNSKKKLTRRETLKSTLVFLVLFLIFANVGGKTVDKVPSAKVSQQEILDKKDIETAEENSSQEIERKIYIEPETAEYDPETEKWIICSNEDKQISSNEIKIKPGTEKYFAEINAWVICSKSPIIGSTKEQVLTIFKDWKRNDFFEKIARNSLQFENDYLIISIDFNSNDIVEGVSFLSLNLKGDDMITGENTYVNKNYDELVSWATGGKKIKIERNNKTKYPVDIFIGNVHEE